MGCDGAAVFTLIEHILCVVCLVYKRHSDNEALRVFYHLEKLSREWPLINNITWNENGALLADVTFGGFIIVTLGLLVGRLLGELKHARRTVCLFLVVGCILFLVVGGLCLAAVDQVPHHLVDNAIILGVLSILTGLLFLIDLAFTGNKSRTDARKQKPVKLVQASSSPMVQKKEEKKVEEKKVNGKLEDETKTKKGLGVFKELRSSLKRKKTVEDLDGKGVIVERNVEFEEKNYKTEPERSEVQGSEYRQYGRRAMDNRGFPRTASDDSGRFSSERYRNDLVDAERDRGLYRDFDRADSRNVSVVEGTYDREGRGGRRSSMLELELDEHYLRPQDYYIEKRVTREERERERERERRLQDQRVSSSRHDVSDDEHQAQLPSVSFLLSERGRKVMPSVSTSPVERLQEVAPGGKPRYYYNSSRDPASGSSAPPSPRSPGYVLHTASAWEDKTAPSTVSDRVQHWFRSRQPAKAP